MNPIICVTEFTERTFEAAKVAAAFARRLGERVVLVRSVDEREQFPVELRSRLVREDWRRLAQEAQQLRQLGFDFEELVLRGRPEDSIARLAWKSGARLVVVACEPTGALDRWALGSLPEEIATTSMAPLLAVRTAEAFEPWLHGDRALNLFVALDPAARPEAVFHRLDELCEMGRCTITAGFLAYPEVDHSGSELEPPELHEPQFRPDRELSEKLSRELAIRRLATRQLPTTDAEAALIEQASAAKADLVVIATHPRSERVLFSRRSLAQAVLRRAPMNVLCVPEPAIETALVSPAGRRGEPREVTDPPRTQWATSDTPRATHDRMMS